MFYIVNVHPVFFTEESVTRVRLSLSRVDSWYSSKLRWWWLWQWSRRIGDEHCVVHTFLHMCISWSYYVNQKNNSVLFILQLCCNFNKLTYIFYSDSSCCVILHWMQIKYYRQHSLPCYMFHFNEPSLILLYKNFKIHEYICSVYYWFSEIWLVHRCLLT